MAEVEATVAHFKKNLKTFKKKYKFHPKVLMNYEVFNRNRTAELYEFFWNLDVVGHPDLSGAELVEQVFLDVPLSRVRRTNDHYLEWQRTPSRTA